MELFDRLPSDFFKVLTSSKKELYVAAILVLRQAFKTELIIRRTDFIAMLIDTLENRILLADFSEESAELGADAADGESLSGKAHFLVRVLEKRGWIEKEYETGSFIENISVPDYAIATADLLYQLSEERVSEYNGYIYATYASLKSCDDNPEYRVQALSAAHANSARLITELKSLYNNIGRYYSRILQKTDVNELLHEHFDEYREQLFDTIYYPLKTIDSVPRFRHPILSIVHSWEVSDEIIQSIAEQGVQRRIFEDMDTGREQTMDMLLEISATYEKIEDLIAQIDQKHTEYTRASIEKIRYALNVDRSEKGRLVCLLKAAGRPDISEAMQNAVTLYGHRYLDSQSAYSRIRRTAKSEGKSAAIRPREENTALLDGFLRDVRRQYSDRKIDDYVHALLGRRQSVTTADVTIRTPDEFILFLLCTVRGQEKGADYQVDFADGYLTQSGCELPNVTISRKRGT